MRSNGVLDPVAERLLGAEIEVAALVDAVRDGELLRLAHAELADALRRARALQARLEYVVLGVLREVDVRGSHVDDGALSAAAWARQQARMAPHDAAAAIRAARALAGGEIPATARALAEGEIDAAHVRCIADAVTDAPAGAAELIEPEALEAARSADPRAVAAVMRQFRHALDPDAADAAALRRYERRGLTLAALPDSSLHIRGLADEATGSLIATAIDAANPVVAGDTRSAAQRRLDALGDICRAYLAGSARSGSGGRPHVIVTVDADTLDERHPGPFDRFGPSGGGRDCGGSSNGGGSPEGGGSPDGGRSPADGGGRQGGSPGAMLSWVGPIAGSTARRLACDADHTIVILDRNGRVIAEQSERRFFTPAQRRAMIARDGDRCVVPYCDRPVSWADGHHLTPVGRGGPTTVDNGALPCAAHHTLLHEGGWHLQRLPDGRYEMHHPDGRVIGPEPHPPGHLRAATWRATSSGATSNQASEPHRRN